MGGQREGSTGGSRGVAAAGTENPASKCTIRFHEAALRVGCPEVSFSDTPQLLMIGEFPSSRPFGLHLPRRCL
jgi:hypothetical protein